MSRGIVTKPDPTYIGGKGYCIIDDKPFPQSKTKPRQTCSINCRQILSRLRRRQGETCMHPEYGTGVYQVTDSFWFIPAADPIRRYRIRPGDIKFVKNRRPRPDRIKDKAFTADNKDHGHDPAWTSQLWRNDVRGVTRSDSGDAEGDFVAKEERNEALGSMPEVQGRVRFYGKRSRGGRHVRRRDYSAAIGVYEMLVLAEVRKSKEKKVEKAT